MLEALGNWVFGSIDGFFMSVTVGDKALETDVLITYCPFCGTRLLEIGSIALDKYMRPRRRARRIVRAIS